MRAFSLFCGLFWISIQTAWADSPVTSAQKLAAQSTVNSFLRAIERGGDAEKFIAPNSEMKISLQSEQSMARAQRGLRLVNLRFSRWNWHQSQLGFRCLGVRLILGRKWILKGGKNIEIDQTYLLELRPDGDKFKLARRIWRTDSFLNALGKNDNSLERTAIFAEEQVENPLRLSRLSLTQEQRFQVLAEKYARAVVARDEKSALALGEPSNTTLRDFFRAHVSDGAARLRGVRLIFPRLRDWNSEKTLCARALVDWDQKFDGKSERVTKTLLLNAKSTPQGLRLRGQYSYLEHDTALARASDLLRGAMYLDDFETKLAAFPRPVPAATRKQVERDISAMLQAHLQQDEAKVRAFWLPQSEAPDLSGVLQGMKSDAKTHMENVQVSDFGRFSLEQDETGPILRARAFVRWNWHDAKGEADWNERWWNFKLRPRGKSWKIAARWRRPISLSQAFRGVESAESRAVIARDEHHGETRRAASSDETAAATQFFSALLDCLRQNNRAALAALCFPDSLAFGTLSDNLNDKDTRAAMTTLGQPKISRVESVNRDGKTYLEARSVAPMIIASSIDPYVFIIQIERDGDSKSEKWRARRAFWRDDDLIASLGANSIAQSAYLLDFERDKWNLGFFRELVDASQKESLKNAGGTKALYLCEASLQLAAFLGDADLLGDAYTRRGGILESSFKGEKRGESAGVTDDYRQSLVNFRAAGNRPYIGFGLHRLGDAASTIADYSLAEKFELAALKHARRCDDTVTQTLVFQGLGNIYSRWNQDARAASFWERARALSAQENFYSSQTDALVSLGAWNFNRGQIGRGLATLGESLQLARRHDLVSDQINALRALSQGAIITGQWGEAIARLEAARALAKKTGDPASEFNIVQNLRDARGARYLDAGAPDNERASENSRADLAAVVTLTVDLAVLQKELPVSLSNESMVASSYLRQTEWTLGVAALEPPGKATTYLADEDDMLDTIQDYATKRKQPARLAKIHLLRGELRRLQGRFAAGIAELDAARPYYEAGTDNLGALADLHRFEGNNWRDQKEWAKAADAYRASIAITEKQRAGAGDAALESGLLAGNVAAYQRLAECLLRLGAKPGEILGAVEAARARALVELMERGNAPQNTRLTPISLDLKNRQNELQNTVAGLQKRLDAFASGNESSAKTLALARAASDLGASEGFGEVRVALSATDVKAQLQNARLELDAFERNLNARNAPKSPISPWQAPPASQLLQLFAAHPKRRILMFQVGDQSTLTLILRLDAGEIQIETSEIPISRVALRAQVEAARKSWSRPSNISDDQSELETLLLGGAQNALRGADELVIIPDDCLAALPFGALNDENGEFLIQKFPISYAPGLIALLQMENRAAALRTDEKRAVKDGASEPFLGISRSAFPEIGLKSLPGTSAEVAAIAPLFGKNALVAQDAKATKAFARRELPRARLIHLATHGLLNEAAPLYSAVALAPDAADSDGRLYARDLLELKLRADLVVLSACETALGQQVRGEGVLGLTWALFVAGAPASVVTQWSVDDAATSTLMQHFYGELKAGKAPADALRDAQLALLKSKTMKHPAYWAPFIVVGAGS